MDYATLQKEGLRQLQLLTGGLWTDFNAHDPGITLLEQLCYALTDLGYRIGYEIPELLADAGADPYASLHSPEEILTSHPVTPADLRRLVLDVQGVKNAWVEVLDASEPACYYLPEEKALSLTPPERTADPIRLRGLLRVLIEAAPGQNPTLVKGRVARRLHANRGLCEDLEAIKVLEPQDIWIEAIVETEPVDDPTALLSALFHVIADELAPPVQAATVAQLLDAGRPVDDILEGPRMNHDGLFSDAALASAARRSALHTSDLMRVVMSVPGVRAVIQMRLSTGGSWEDWSLEMDRDRVARIATAAATIDGAPVAGSKITLRRGGKITASGGPPGAASASSARPLARSFARPPGRDRDVGKYTSVQHHLPLLYGLGELGLPDSAPPQRKAQARQLKAYLLFFDQLLANDFAQLAHVKDLLSYDSADPRSYFAQALDQPGLALEEVCTLDTAHLSDLQGLLEDPAGPSALLRKHRFLNHLLSRFAERVDMHEEEASPAERTQRKLESAQRKQALLRHYPRCSSARGTGRDCLQGDPEGQAGLSYRVQHLLGLSVERGEVMIAVEHVLLRPMAEDLLVPEPLLMAQALYEDPYSLRVTFVLPEASGRFTALGFREVVEQTICAETPAHLAPAVLWMKDSAWEGFVDAHQRWLEQRRAYLANGLSVPLDHLRVGARPIDLRGARDRLIDLLGLGETYPLRDTQVQATQPMVAIHDSAVLRIDPGQRGVRYQLYEGESAVVPACIVDGTGDVIELLSPALEEDKTFRIWAFKIDSPARATFLLQTVTVKVGLDTSIPAVLDSAIIDYQASASVTVKGSQSGVAYVLCDADLKEISLAPVLGNSSEITLLTRPLQEDTQIQIRATRTFDTPQGPEIQTAVLSVKLSLAVRANPDLAVTLEGSAVVDYQGSAALVLSGSQRSVVYSAYARALMDGDFMPSGPALVVKVPGAPEVRVAMPPRPASWQVQPGYRLLATAGGNDGALRLSLGPLQEDSVIVVQAHKDHAAGASVQSDLQLAQAASAFVRPAPVPTLALKLTANPDGVGGTLLVTGGQPGVYYHLRRPGDPTELGRPAYFHKLDEQDPSLNKGIGQLRIEMDLAITREPPPPPAGSAVDLPHLRPLPPLIDVATLPLDGSVSVLAVKARTGVAWAASRGVAVNAPPTPQ